ncbi:hypothetical protein [Geomicrobium sp. JCM 19039]|uniref:hypothetical protein n=1 Tax=Geomicrobium sp. JCM 19039 TaxID=1460636 RepID=UPI00045F1BAE|nr:hypothetical protein [Geomicrobium sp. JCM 19039]GAK10604.1 phosphate ABC transporter, periplasmic phosphate-binding protein PstS [Geomicrobium sp. JCM 19039]
MIVIWTFLAVFDIFTRKVRGSSLGIGLCLILLTLGVVQFQSYQESQLETITEADVEIDHYIPYTNDNTLATLDKEASIQFDDDLPVLDGATALYPIYAAFAEAVYPEVRITLTEVPFEERKPTTPLQRSYTKRWI